MRSAILAISFMTFVIGCNKPAGGSGGASTSGWTHKDLLDALKAKGLDVEMFPAGKSKVYLVGMEGWKKGQAFDAALLDAMYSNGSSDEIAIVELCESPRQASERAGVHGSRGWSSGRFSFVASEASKKFLSQVQIALKG